MDYLRNRSFFLNHPWYQGFDTFVKGRVDILKEKGNIVNATVHGTMEDYSVSLKFKDDGVLEEAKCTCPSQSPYCHHVAALLFALNEEHHAKDEKTNVLIRGEKFDDYASRYCMTYGKDQEEYFSRIESLYLFNYLNWEEYYQTTNFLKIFRYAKDFYNRLDLSSKMLVFLRKLHFSTRPLKNIFDGYYRMILHLGTENDFLMQVIKEEQLRPIFCSILQDKIYDYEYKPFQDVVFQKPSLFIPVLDKKTISVLISEGNRVHRDVSSILYELIDEKRDSLLEEMMEDSSSVLSIQDENLVWNHFIDVAYQNKDISRLLYIINHTDVSFKGIYCYYKLLKPIDQAKVKEQLRSVCSSLGYSRQFAILIGEEKSPSALSGLELEDWIVLSPEIKERFQGKYEKHLEAAINKALGRGYSAYQLRTVYSVMENYLEDYPKLLTLDSFRNATFHSSKSREEFLLLLKRHHALSKAGIMEYPN